MKKISQIPAIFLSLIFCITSCTKSTDKFVPYSTEFNDTNWSPSAMDAAKSTIIITTLSKPLYTGSFSSSNNALLDFNNQIQLGLQGNTYLLNGVNYSGKVSVNLMQLSSKGDYIRNLISSCSSTNLFDTKSAFLLNLTDDSKNNLSIANGTSYTIDLVDTPLAQNYIYLSGSIETNNVTWALADSTNTGYLQANSILMNGQTQLSYEIISKKLSWINFAKPISASILVNSNVLLSTKNFTNKNTVVFAVLNDYNTVLKLQSDDVNKVFLAKNLPLGSSVKLVSISYIDGQFYIGKHDILVSTTPQYSLKPSIIPASIADVNTFLDSL